MKYLMKITNALLSASLVLSLCAISVPVCAESISEEVYATSEAYETEEYCSEISDTSLTLPSDVLESDSAKPQADIWRQEGFPSDISYAYKSGGEAREDGSILEYWEIGLIGATEARKAELETLFGSDCRLTFTDMKYSFNEREAALNEIILEVKENRDFNFVDGRLTNNTDKVYVVVKDEVFDEYSARYSKKYGDMIVVARESEKTDYTDIQMTDGLIETGGNTGLGALSELNRSDDGNITSIIVFVAIGLLLLSAVGYFLLKARKTAVAEGANGGNINVEATNASPTRSEIVKVIKSGDISPREGLFDDIKKKIDE